MILQLNPPIQVQTPLGDGYAIFLIDYGVHLNTCWVVALAASGVIKHFDANDIVLSPNHTYKINSQNKV